MGIMLLKLKNLNLILISFLFLSLFLSCAKGDITGLSHNKGINIIPTPESIIMGQGDYVLSDKITISICNDSLRKVVGYFANKIETATGYQVLLGDTSEPSCDIKVSIIPDLSEKKEGYLLRVTDKGVTIEAREPVGVFYALGTLMQLLPAEIESSSKVKASKWSIPFVTINDSPRFEYRGIMLDVSRHFISASEIKKHLEIFSMYKINRFHWHLSDNQGWRLEVKSLPELTKRGSSREDANGEVHKGYYTTDEVKDIVQFAADRFITVIPEIDIPAHSMAACVAYPELSCTGCTPPIRSVWGCDTLVMCPGKDYMFKFLDTLFSEMTELFPSEYYHIGGDECPKNNWKLCPHCQARIKKEGLKRDARYSAEDKLQSYTIKRVEKLLAKYGKRIIGWNEIIDGGLSPTACVMSWQGESGGIEAAMQGNDVIMTPQDKALYLNHYQGSSKAEGIAFGKSAMLEALYSYNPVPEQLYETGKASHVKGVQANLWSEYVYSNKSLQRNLYPRVLALSEIAWSRHENLDFADFCRRMDNNSLRLTLHGSFYHIPLPEQPGGSMCRVAFTDTLALLFTSSRPLTMVYTTDGSVPSLSSSIYKDEISVNTSCTLRIACVSQAGVLGEERVLDLVKEPYAPAVKSSKAGMSQGIRALRYKGEFNVPADLVGVRESDSRIVSSLSALVQRGANHTLKREVPRYAIVAEGYFMVHSDDVYVFSTDNDELWIDDKLLISNVGEVKRHSRNDASTALAKGLHKIKIVFISNFLGGWPSYWNNSAVQYKPYHAGSKFTPLAPKDLFVE